MNKVLKTIIGCGVLIPGLIFATEVAEPGLTNLLKNDMTTWSNEHIVGAGDTAWTATYLWSGDGGDGVYFLEFDIDTFAACSSRVELLLREGNTDGDWTYCSSLFTSATSALDWDTLLEINFSPAAYFRFGILSKCGSNDSDKVSSLKLFGIK